MSEEFTVPAQIIEFIFKQKLTEGAHLSAQVLADHFSLSRTPVTKALAVLEQKGVVCRQPNKGYFLCVSLKEPLESVLVDLDIKREDLLDNVYFQIAEDRLQGLLGNEFSEQQIKKRYSLTASQLQSVLSRISEEGWASKKPGYGWVFSPMLTTPDSLLQTYRLRLALEPAALLEPGYHIEQSVIERCREVETQILSQGIDDLSIEQLHQRGVNFHLALVEASGNPFFIDTLHRIHRVRRLLSYRSMQDRQRYHAHAQQHLEILNLLEQKRNVEASEVLRKHLEHTIKNVSQISHLLTKKQRTNALKS
ncbi:MULTISPECIES: GntR family transcriptional regulator [Vibrio]|uniref:GntR family transcriptional regulator n=1 Tax=Vibrio TaxID=662 RepID=UPI001C9D0860|nr:GntR family transcriptional regulator [Vibrio furnissii]EKO3516032.1 GntR family transcriptional regulator [Vibrio fluvialis]MBY8316087.1 GntR family transcriptional regulator [Vibrio fluvialis]MCG6266381.1 GntR family transcriptional regulator [Vibrio furnissii]